MSGSKNEKNEKNVDAISPDHYKIKANMEVIDIISFACEGLNGPEGYCLGNAIKYLIRANKKNNGKNFLEDCKKAQWYINYLINEIK